MPAIIEDLAPHFEQTIVVPTENARRVISQRELDLIDGIEVVDSFFDRAILPHPPYGIVLVAPCTFNSLNKLANGIADTLALSIVSEAIGRQTPIVVAVSVNPPLYAHPRTNTSIETLESWGIDVVLPAEENGWTTLAANEDITRRVLAVRTRRAKP